MPYYLSNIQTAESTQQAAWTMLADMLPHLAVGIVVLGTDHQVVSWDSQAESIMGYTRKQLQQVDFVSLFIPADVMRQTLRKAQQGMSTLGEFMELRRTNHSRVPVIVQCSPQYAMRHPEGQVVVVFRPLSPLQDQLHRHEHLYRLGRLASALSHEIRNPLSTLLLNADLLEETIQQSTCADRIHIAAYVDEIKTQLSRMHELVEDYLTLSRLSNRHREPESLKGLIEDLTRSLQARLTTCRIALHIEGVDTLPLVPCHKGTLRRALLNLMQNSIDAMPQGGILTLRCRRQEGRVHLSICDTGGGIAEEHLPSLFVPFHTTKPGGTGLGLVVVQEIIAAHGGTIEVSTSPGTGTVFTITLPIEP